MAPSVWFCLNIRKGSPGYLEVSGGGLALTKHTVVTIKDELNMLEWDVEDKQVEMGKLKLRIRGKHERRPEITPPTSGSVSVTVTNPNAGTILVQAAYIDEDTPAPPPPPPPPPPRNK